MTPANNRRRPAGDRAPSTEGKGKHSGAQGTEANGVVVVIAALEAAGYIVEHKGSGHWLAQCPCHDDTEASLHIDVRPHIDQPKRWVPKFGCRVCRANGGDVCRELVLPLALLMNDHSRYAQKPPGRVRPLTTEHIERWEGALWSQPSYRRYLLRDRRLMKATLRRYGIGYDEGTDRYTLPVFDGDDLVNARRYLADAPPGEKMRNWPGRGSPPRLYPALPPSGKNVVVCEGEWDALLLNQAGVHAVTGTHGADTFPDDWVALFKGRHVAFVFDCDEAGRTYSAEHAAKVATVAKSVRVVDLGLGDKEDVTDWFRQGRSASALKALINAAVPLGRRR